MRSLTSGIIIAGLLVGVFVGIVGTGGAFIIPVLIYIFKLGQLKAQGTALLIAASPIWFFPFIPYWRSGKYEFRIAVLLGIGVASGVTSGRSWRNIFRRSMCTGRSRPD